MRNTKKQAGHKTAKNIMSAVLTALMAMSSAGSVTAVNLASVSAKTTVKKTTKKSTKKTVKKSTAKTKKKTPKVYITPTSKTIYTKSSTYLYLKNNKGTVKWYASNTKVTLSKKTKGSVKVYGKSAGTSYVTAKVGKKKYTTKVTVKNPVKKVPAVYITPTSKTIYTKSSTYVYLKNNKSNVTWTASNSKISLSKKSKTSVKVYGKSAGTSYVTAKVGNKKYTVKVTVKAKSSTNNNSNVQAKLNKTSINVTMNVQQDDLKYIPERDYGIFDDMTTGYKEDDPYIHLITSDSDEVKWTSSNQNVVKIIENDSYSNELNKVDNYAKFRTYNFGTATVTATYKGNKYPCKITVSPSSYYIKGNQIVNSTTNNTMDSATKAAKLAIYVSTHMKYGRDPSTGANLESFFAGIGTCSDYSTGYEYLLLLAKIQSRGVESDSADHAYNQVLLDGGWVNVDPTNLFVYLDNGSLDNTSPLFMSDQYINEHLKNHSVQSGIAPIYRDGVCANLTATNTKYDNFKVSYWYSK